MPLVAALAGAAVVIVGAYFAYPRQGQLAINVSDSKGGAVRHLEIFIDGKKTCEESPCMQDVSSGFHQVKVSSDGYNQAADQVVAVSSGKAATATFTLFPTEKPGDTAAASQDVSGQAPAAAAPAAVAVADTPQAADTHPADKSASAPATDSKNVGSASHVTSSPAAVAVSKPPPAAAGGGGEGFLNINSIPPSTCFLDGKSLGTTPKVHISVPSGAHVVKFVNADQGLTKTISVRVAAGETKPAIARLE
jgi:hypothetical protein